MSRAWITFVVAAILAIILFAVWLNVDGLPDGFWLSWAGALLVCVMSFIAGVRQ